MKEIKKHSKNSSYSLKSFAKINLTFEVLRKTENSLHEITGVFQTMWSTVGNNIKNYK